MAKKPSSEAASTTTTEGAAAATGTPAIDPAAYYRVTATSRFRAFGAGFGATSQTEVTGAILTRLLASEHAGKVTGWAPV